MTMTEQRYDPDEIRDALRMELETDRLLGVRDWPVAPKSPSQQRTQAPEPDRAPEPVSNAELEARNARLKELDEKQVRACTACALAKTRTKTVFGQGSAAARIMFVGEAPGFEEDRQGLAFVGRAGQLLTRMVQAMGLTRDEVFIGNVLKCRPPNNRTPSHDEIAACSGYLFEQISIIDPQVLIALGAPASQTLLNTHDSIGRLRGRWHNFMLMEGPLAGKTIPLMATYHPAYLLRSPGEKGKTWADLQMVMAELGLRRP